MTKSFPFTYDGVATPSPTGTRHSCFNSFGHVAGTLKSVTFASRFCPRHCGQSAAEVCATAIMQANASIIESLVDVFIVAVVTSGRSRPSPPNKMIDQRV